MNRRDVLGLVALGAAAYAAWAWRESLNTDPPAPDEEVATVASYTLRGTTIITPGEDGAPLYRLNASDMAHEVDSGLVQMDEVRLEYNHESPEPWVMTADHGEVRIDWETIELSGSVVINVLTLIGVGLLLQEAAWAMTAIRLAGASYLAWLAWGALRKAVNPPSIRAVNVAPAPSWRYFLAGFLLQIMNPKAIAFWIAIAAVGATAGGGAGIVLLFVTGAWVISFACHGGWALLLSGRAFRRAYAAGRRWVDMSLGGFFAFAAWKMATERG